MRHSAGMAHRCVPTACAPHLHPVPYPVELAAETVQGLQLALATNVGLVDGEVLATALLGQQAAGLAPSNL